MKILVVGGGGREHALAWKLAASPKVQVVYVAPGNAGTAADKRLENLPIKDHATLALFAERENIELTVVGPDAELANGIVDLFQSKGLPVFGPTRAAAQLEWSKDFAKAFMKRHNIPTAAYETFSSAYDAHAYVEHKGAPIVIKADGLAAGKGVVVAQTADEAHAAIDSMLVDNKFGASGARVVIEEFMAGEEASFFVLCDGKNALPFATAQDHKRLLDADQGPNTGGMGAYSPAPLITPAIHNKIMSKIVRPTLAGMAAEGNPFTGFLYVGLMIGKGGEPRVVEFNARMGDPETQPVMMRLKSDLVVALEAALEGKLDTLELDWDRRTALGVVMASEGYPEAPRIGDPIYGIPAATEDSLTFHAGTTVDTKGHLLTAGGRVLCCTALGDSVRMAQRRAYQVVEEIKFRGAQYRKDIGHRAINKKT
ncbi:MAG: phosphoribosylamine--glycine ligase [Burkholderiaceae bacterium]